MSTAVQAEPACPTKEELAMYVASKDKERKLAAESRLAGKAAELVEKKIEAYVEHQKKLTGKTTFQRTGFIISIEDGAVRPKWADLFIIHCGAAKAKQVIDSTPPSQVLKVAPANT